MPLGRRGSSAARTAAAAGAAAGGAASTTGRTTTAAAVGPATPPAPAGTAPAVATVTARPRRNTLAIVLGALGALLLVGVLAYFMRPSVNVSVSNGGSHVTVILPGSHPGPVSAPTYNPPTRPASPSASPSPKPSASSSPAESGYSHWISPSNVTTACHEQASPKSTAVFQPALWPAQQVPKDWYCQDVQNMSYAPWYSNATSQPLGPIISYSVNLNLYCQYTYGQNGGQWQAEDGPNNANAGDPPGPTGSDPFPHEMCYKVPNSGS